VFFFAVAIAVFSPLYLGGLWSDWIYRALVLLVVACPCALVISTQVSIVSGLAAAAHKRILVKGGAYLEIGSKLSFVALDKTGTITHGIDRDSRNRSSAHCCQPGCALGSPGLAGNCPA
jgi:Cd2+/Zn2+-exporting ATPase